MGGYSYKKRNKAVKQSFKNRRSSPRNINIMIGGEEPAYEMVGGDMFDRDIKLGFDAIDNYFKTAFIPKDVNKVYIEKDGLNVEVLTRATTPGAAVNPPAPGADPSAAAVNPPGAGQQNVNTNANIALSIANVIQKAFDVLTTARSNKKKNTKAAAATNVQAAAATHAAAETKKRFVQPEVVSVITTTLKVIQYGVDQTALNNLTVALTKLTATFNELPS